MKKCIIACIALMLVSLLFCSALAAQIVFTGDSNVRYGPSKDAGIAGTVKKGSSLPYLGDQSVDSRGVVWYCVSYSGYEAWVSSKYSYISGGSSSVYDIDDFDSYVEDNVVYVWGDSNIRSSANLNGKILTTVRKGNYIDFLGTYAYDDRGVIWYKVYYNGYTGWISSRYTTVWD